MSTPKISVIMSVYNCESTVTAALESIFNQTYTNWEMVVCDDASTDGTRERLLQAIESIEDSRVTILTNETNQKLAYSLNRCLGAATGQLIARMDGDDLSAPDRFERQVRFLDEHPEVDLVGTAMRRFDSNGLGEIVGPASLEPDRWTMGRSTKVAFCHATILARRSAFETVGNYTVSWRTVRAEDLDLWFKFFAAGLVGRNLPDPLYLVRVDEAAVRRRTPRARLEAFSTRIIGAWSLRYPPRAYAIAMFDLLKVLVPYRIVDWHVKRSRSRPEAKRPSESEPE